MVVSTSLNERVTVFCLKVCGCHWGLRHGERVLCRRWKGLCLRSGVVVIDYSRRLRMLPAQAIQIFKQRRQVPIAWMVSWNVNIQRTISLLRGIIISCKLDVRALNYRLTNKTILVCDCELDIFYSLLKN